MIKMEVKTSSFYLPLPPPRFFALRNGFIFSISKETALKISPFHLVNITRCTASRTVKHANHVQFEINCAKQPPRANKLKNPIRNL